MTIIDLNGTWHATWKDSCRGMVEKGAGLQMDPARYIPVQVPGEIHLDLMRAGLLEDPYIGMNILKARWVETMVWSCRRNVTVPAEAVAARSWLYLDKLDLAARIYLNGELIGEHCNFFHPCRIETTGLLREGDNCVAVQVESGLIASANQSVEGLGEGGREVTKRLLLRKPQFQGGWDWAVRLLNVGLSGPVRLEYTCDELRADQFVPLVTVDEDLRSAEVGARWYVEHLGEEATELEFRVRIPELDLEQSRLCRVEPGQQRCDVSLSVPDPELWWPVGHGAPRRYRLEASLHVGGREIAACERQIGFRRVEIDQSPHPERGQHFTLRINNRPVFCKGGNWVPADMIYAAVDRQRYQGLIDKALGAHFNMLRVWGGGQYESDAFYDYCDARGVLVWQEFIFAGGKYPAYDRTFHDSVVTEATWNIRRLAAHPSLVIWCGNNELELHNTTKKFGEQGQVIPHYQLFHYTLPRLMRAEDPTRFYWPSSPYSPDHKHPNCEDCGDQHSWDIGIVFSPESMDFQRHRQRTGRFACEGGFLGPSALPTMQACLDTEGAQAKAFAWRLHGNLFQSDPCVYWIGRSRDDMSLEEFVYWGGLLQGEALREMCDNYRRRMFTESAAALFWMYNDCWPCTWSWTIVDYYQRRTPSYHPVRRALAPISVVVVEEDASIVVYGINDSRETRTGMLRHGVFTLSGTYLMDEGAPVTLAPNASTVIASFPSAEWHDRQSSMAFAVLSDHDGRLLARNRLSQGWFKDLEWSPADVAVQLENGHAVFTSNHFVMGICIDLDGEADLPDNFFDCYPGQPYAIPWPGTKPPQILFTGNLERTQESTISNTNPL